MSDVAITYCRPCGYERRAKIASRTAEVPRRNRNAEAGNRWDLRGCRGGDRRRKASEGLFPWRRRNRRGRVAVNRWTAPMTTFRRAKAGGHSCGVRAATGLRRTNIELNVRKTTAMCGRGARKRGRRDASSALQDWASSLPRLSEVSLIAPNGSLGSPIGACSQGQSSPLCNVEGRVLRPIRRNL